MEWRRQRNERKERYLKWFFDKDRYLQRLLRRFEQLKFAAQYQERLLRGVRIAIAQRKRLLFQRGSLIFDRNGGYYLRRR